MLGIVDRISTGLSTFRLYHKRIVHSPECPCKHSFFRPERYNDHRYYGNNFQGDLTNTSAELYSLERTPGENDIPEMPHPKLS